MSVDLASISPGGRPIDESPFSTSRTSNFVARGGGLPPYVRGVAHALMRERGIKSESQAIQMAIGVMKNWASGRGKVRPQVRAAAAKAVAEWEALKAKAHANLSVDDAQTINLVWDESKHPRNHGKFAPKGSQTIGASPKQPSSNLPDEVRAQIRDFQRRNHLPVTGVFDAATKAKISGLTNPSSGAVAKKAASAAKRAAREQAAAARKAARKAAAKTRHQQALERASRARTAAAVNRLSAPQRAAYRKRVNAAAPAGYTWTANNHLRATGTTAEARQVAALAGPKTTSPKKGPAFRPGVVRHLSQEDPMRVIELSGRRYGVIELNTPMVSADDGQRVTVNSLAKSTKAARKPVHLGFDRLVKMLEAKGHPHDRAVKIAVAIGRAKYGHAGFAALSAKGRAKQAVKKAGK